MLELIFEWKTDHGCKCGETLVGTCAAQALRLPFRRVLQYQ